MVFFAPHVFSVGGFFEPEIVPIPFDGFFGACPLFGLTGAMVFSASGNSPGFRPSLACFFGFRPPFLSWFFWSHGTLGSIP